jgi:hypothetical protein
VNFELPHLPGVLMMTIGNPSVASEEREGRSWFIQTHEFALFPQKNGALDVPACPVRYVYREGFTGPEQDAKAEVPVWSVDIGRPPGSEQLGFLITTGSLEVSESWDPEPGPAEVGAVFKRTIDQRATPVSGMASAPASKTAPDGIRIYTGDVEADDQLGRGDVIGKRRETLTYLLQKSGTFCLPALTYAWPIPLKESGLLGHRFSATPSRLEAQADADRQPACRDVISEVSILEIDVEVSVADKQINPIVEGVACRGKQFPCKIGCRTETADIAH